MSSPDFAPATSTDISKTVDNIGLLIDEATSLSLSANQTTILALSSTLEPEKFAAAARLLRRGLHKVSRSWNQLKGARIHLLRNEEDELIQQFELAINPEFEGIFSSYDSLCRNAIDAYASEAMPDATTLTELSKLTSTAMAQMCNSLLKAAHSLADTSAEYRKDRAHIDEVTGLPNRRGLQRFIRRFSEEEWPHQQFSVIQMDVNKFKQINNSLGLDAGDAALVHVTDLIRHHAAQEDFVARIGGDEFVIASFGACTKQRLLGFADQLLDALSEPFQFQGKNCDLRSSIGIASAEYEKEPSVRKIVANADRALQRAKQTGGSQKEYFSKNLRLKFQNTDELQSQILEGLENGEFEAFYQPQIESRSGKLVGFEALARWRHPERGVLTPFHFLDALEEADLLFQLDLQIMQTSFAEMRGWMDAGYDVPQVSINLSSDRLLRPDLLDSLKIAAEEAGVPTSKIGIEILESAMIDESAARMIDNINKLSDAGFVVELDDFGTGHASVSNLQNFKVDRIKIDRSFVKDIHLQTDLAKITSAMIGLAHSLRIDALAEGVETPEERLILNALGCDHIQGFGVSHPLPASQVTPWIKKTQLSKRELPARKETTH